MFQVEAQLLPTAASVFGQKHVFYVFQDVTITLFGCLCWVSNLSKMNEPPPWINYKRKMIFFFLSFPNMI